MSVLRADRHFGSIPEKITEQVSEYLKNYEQQDNNNNM